MSRRRAITCWSALRFPRVSGDEPYGAEQHHGKLKFSPRERG